MKTLTQSDSALQSALRVQNAIEALKRGQCIIVTDDHDRENEGDLIFPAENMTPEIMSFIVNHTTGIICVSMLQERLEELSIPLMVSQNTDSFKTAFGVSVDYIHGTTTGVSSADRTATVRALANKQTQPRDLARPGHIFPLRYYTGGVLRRKGHTEASVDFMQLAGFSPVAVLAEIKNLDGTMARTKELNEFAEKYSLVQVSISDLVAYRLSTETLVEKISEARLPTKYGEFTLKIYRSFWDQEEHFVLSKGDIEDGENIPLRIHSECITGEIFHSVRCDCGPQLDFAMKKIAELEKGMIIYLRGHEGRGIGLAHKLNAYNLQDQGKDTVEANLALGFEADQREYGAAYQILKKYSIRSIELMTNNPKKCQSLADYGVIVSDRIPIIIEPTQESKYYLHTKKERLGHWLP